MATQAPGYRDLSRGSLHRHWIRLALSSTSARSSCSEVLPACSSSSCWLYVKERPRRYYYNSPTRLSSPCSILRFCLASLRPTIMTSQVADSSSAPPTLPPLDIEQAGGGVEKGPVKPIQPRSARGSAEQPTPPSHRTGPGQATYRFLSPGEWARVAHGLGAIQDDQEHRVVHPSSWYFPPKGMPHGLYRDVVSYRSKSQWAYHFLSSVCWGLMVLQIVLAAILTALGSLGSRDGTPITVIAAIQTVIAGLLALLHNSGLPSRYRSNQVEFSMVESHLRYGDLCSRPVRSS